MTIATSTPPTAIDTELSPTAAYWPRGMSLEIHTVGMPPDSEAASLAVFESASVLFQGTPVTVHCMDAMGGTQWREHGIVIFPTTRLMIEGREIGRSTELFT